MMLSLFVISVSNKRNVRYDNSSVLHVARHVSKRDLPKAANNFVANQLFYFFYFTYFEEFFLNRSVKGNFASVTTQENINNMHDK